MQDIEIAQLPRFGGKELRIRLRQYEGRLLGDLRVFAPGRDGTLRPTKAGVSFAVGKLGTIIAGLEKARDRAKEIAEEHSR